MQFDNPARESSNFCGDNMISEEEKQRYAEASKCSECTQWHHHCKAECCKIVFLKIDPKELEKSGQYLIIKPKQPFTDWRYYSLRDVEYLRGILRFRKDRIIVVGRKVMYIHNCKLLKNNLCEGHPDKKPELCQILTLETSKLLGQGFELTDNCLFKYKCKEVKDDD